jgi:hypothetical protein
VIKLLFNLDSGQGDEVVIYPCKSLVWLLEINTETLLAGRAVESESEEILGGVGVGWDF